MCKTGEGSGGTAGGAEAATWNFANAPLLQPIGDDAPPLLPTPLPRAIIDSKLTVGQLEFVGANRENVEKATRRAGKRA